MFLDQYWLVNPTAEDKTVALLSNQPTYKEEFGYHRKNCEISKHMQTHMKGGDYELVITDEILDGVADYAKKHKNSELKEIIAKARGYLKQGREVIFYESW